MVRRKIIEGMASFFLSSASLSVFGFLTTVIIVRSFTKFDYGQLVFILSIASASSVTLDFGLSSLFVSEIAQAKGRQDYGQAKTILLGYLKLVIIMGIALLSVFSAISVISKIRNFPAIYNLFFLLGIYIFLEALREFFDIFFYSFSLFRYKLLSDVIFSIFRLISVFILVAILKKGLPAVLIAYSISLVAAMLLIFPFWWKKSSPLRAAKTFKGPIYRGILRNQGIFVFPMLLVKRVSEQLPVWVTKVFLGLEAVSVLDIAEKAFKFFYSILSPIENAIFPITSEQMGINWQLMRARLSKITRYTVWVALVMIFLGWFIAQPLFSFIFSGRYQDSIPLFKIYLVLLPVYALMISQRPAFYAFRAQKELFYTYLFAFLLFIPFILIFTGWFGLKGVVSAIIFNAAITYILRRYYLNKIITQKEYMGFTIT